MKKRIMKEDDDAALTFHKEVMKKCDELKERFRAATPIQEEWLVREIADEIDSMYDADFDLHRAVIETADDYIKSSVFWR